MLTIPKTNGTGELLPRLEKVLTSRGISVGRVNAAGAHVGWSSEGAVFVAKKALWRNMVSTQKELIDKCIEHNRWLCFWIPGTGMLRFDPQKFLEKGWKNMRDAEVMINLDIKYGNFIGGDDLAMSPLQKVQQMVMKITSENIKPKSDESVVEELKTWRQKLGIVMAEYSKVFDIPLDKVEAQIYKKYSIGSRTELSTDQLKSEYQSYQAAIQNRIK